MPDGGHPLLLFVEHALSGALLVAIAAVAAAFGAVRFRPLPDTSFNYLLITGSCVLITGLFGTGAILLSQATMDMPGVTRYFGGVVSVVYFFAAISFSWRLFGPKADPLAASQPARPNA